MIGLLVQVLIACIVLWLLYYVVTTLVPAPMQPPARVVLVVIGAIFLIWILLQFVGGSGLSLGHTRVLR